MGQQGLKDDARVDWLRSQFTLPLTLLGPVQENFAQLRAARVVQDAPTLTHVLAPPFNYVYAKVFNARGPRTGKQGGKKRDTPRPDDQPTKKQQVGNSAKGSGDYPTIAEGAAMGKKGKGGGRQPIPRGEADETHTDTKSKGRMWKPKREPQDNN